MVVEFVGGSMNGQIKTMQRFFDYINTEHGETYFARAIQYKNIGWIYVWYEYGGSPTQYEQRGHEILQ